MVCWTVSVFGFQAQQELETEGLKGEFDRTQATQTLETTLDKLLDHFEEKDDQDPEQQPAAAQRANDPTRGSPSLAPKQPGNVCCLPPAAASITLTSHPCVQPLSWLLSSPEQVESA